jgi:hypothetical protein
VCHCISLLDFHVDIEEVLRGMCTILIELVTVIAGVKSSAAGLRIAYDVYKCYIYDLRFSRQ